MSGDALTDWFFRQIVTFLRKENLLVLRKRRLRDPDDKDRRAIRGLMDPLVHPRYIHILINPARDANKDWQEEVETLIHEVSHVMMEDTSERDILKLEAILAVKLTLEQKTYLRSFLPRDIVTHYPTRDSVPQVATA